MNEYRAMKLRHQKEFNAFPMKFAFNRQQFEKGMAELELKPEDTDKIYKAPGGGFYRKEDSPKLKAILDKSDKEMQEAIAADKTGDGFIYQMFYAELADHEYGYTYDATDAIEALGLTWEKIQAGSCLEHGLRRAMAKFT